MSHTSKVASLVLSCGLACAASAQETQTNPLSQFDAGVDINSGRVVNTTDQLTAVISEVVNVEEADWLRLRFDEVTLAGSDEQGNASYLQITSLEDGAVQYLDKEALQQWQHTSAYFNGDTVLVELMAYPGLGFNELSMSSVIAGTPPTLEESICGPDDDRILSSDPRAARALPIGCTAWLIDDCEHCFLTAGHCNGGGNSDINVLQFNVPLSDNSCSFGGINHPARKTSTPLTLPRSRPTAAAAPATTGATSARSPTPTPACSRGRSAAAGSHSATQRLLPRMHASLATARSPRRSPRAPGTPSRKHTLARLSASAATS